jgi:hypothetical protein
MAGPIKHVGRIKSSKNKVLVVFRTLPGESDYCLVLPVAPLSDSYHDDIMKLVESDQAQEAFELGEMMFMRSFSDGRPMLQAMRADGALQRIPTDSVEMTPTPNDVIELSQLNILIAEQKNCAVDDLYTFVSGAPKATNASTEDIAQIDELGKDVGEPTIVNESVPLKSQENQVLSDKDIARSYRSQADSMYKEAAKLRRQADELDPPQKKTVKAKDSIDA